jgi:hypothetical protein
MKKLILIAALTAITFCFGNAQTPVVVQAAGASTPIPRAVAVQPNANADVLRELESMRASNQEILRKQEATLQLLDELEKQADQLRIFASRG